MPEVLGIVVVVVALAACVWLSVSTQNQLKAQLKQLRAELDQTQGQLNETRRQLSDTRQLVGDLQQQLSELKASSVMTAPPPPLPRARSSSTGLDDLREQLRAAHREESASDEMQL